jgi:hypothetical protein
VEQAAVRKKEQDIAFERKLVGVDVGGGEGGRVRVVGGGGVEERGDGGTGGKGPQDCK